MIALSRPLVWLFAEPAPPHCEWRVVGWWEMRRLPFNLVVGVWAVASFVVYAWGVITSGHLQPGEDLVEPLVLVAGVPVGLLLLNFCYLFGWFAEVLIRRVCPNRCLWLSPLMLALGLGLCMAVVSIPGVTWGGYRVLELLGLVS